jgi:hypothetical protein
MSHLHFSKGIPLHIQLVRAEHLGTPFHAFSPALREFPWRNAIVLEPGKPIAWIESFIPAGVDPLILERVKVRT